MVRLKKQTKKEQMVEARRKRRNEDKNKAAQLFDPGQIAALCLFLAMAAVLIIICFVGQSPSGIQFLPNQTAKVRIVADFPFHYESTIQTERLREESRQRIAPVYVCNMDPYHEFSKKIDLLEKALNETLGPQLLTLPKEEWLPTIDVFNRDFRRQHNLMLNNENLLTLMDKTDQTLRQRLFDEGLLSLKEIMQEGIIDSNQSKLRPMSNRGVYQPIEIIGRHNKGQIETYEESLRLLRFNIAGLEADSVLNSALFHIIKRGLTPNLEYNEALTKSREEEAANNVEPVLVRVAKGETIIEPRTRINDEHIEKINAYRSKLNQKDEIAWGLNTHFAQRSILALGLLLAALIHIKVSIPKLADKRRLALASIVFLLNMAIIRLFQEFGTTELFGNSPTLMAILPYLAPVALGAIITTIMIGTSTAVLTALLVSTLNSMMQGSSIETFVVTFLACLVGIYFCTDIRLRVKVVRAGAITGLSVAISACFIGLLNEIDLITIGQQMLVAQVAGVITGIVVIGILPLLENLFKYTTDITLLELTDFNHDLLRKLQMEAPGSYHHSLMVANLSERAASEIGANPLLCRATALFHDIGKMAKPEYFIENQRDGINPHDEKNPNMSALVIKSHIKEGVEMARQAKLPKVCIDIIKQHHGTTLIQYFYHKALKAKEQSLLPLTLSGNSTAGATDESSVDESNFRYDGPKPQFKESAIILLADCVEAASRSLKKVTPQSIDEFVDNIVDSKVEDRQLDESPLTLEELKKIKASFCFTLLNMLHNRVEYPKQEATGKGRAAKKGNTPTPMPQPVQSHASSDSNKRAAI